MTDQKPQWMSLHEESDKKNFDDIRGSLQRIEIKLDPLFDNYITATRLGKWLMAIAVFGSILLGIILSIKSLFVK